MTEITPTTSEAAATEFTSSELRTLLRASPDCVLLFDGQGRYLKLGTGPNAPRCHGASRLLGRRVTEVLGHDLGGRCLETIRRALASGRTLQMDYSLPIDDEMHYFRASVCATGVDDQVLWVGRDVTAQRTADDALAVRYEIERRIGRLSTQFINIEPDRIDRAVDAALGEMGRYCGVDRAYVYRFQDGQRFMVNTHSWRAPGVPSRLGYGKAIPSAGCPWLMDRLRARQVIRLRDVDSVAAEAPDEHAIFRSREVGAIVVVPIFFSGELRAFIGFDSSRRGREWTPDQVHFLEAAGEIFASALQRRDSEEKIYRLAYYDELTDLPNRLLLYRHLEQRLEAASAPLALMLVDLDDYSTLNDLLGHDLGDLVLREVSTRLTALLGPGATLGRWGGDEFMFALPAGEDLQQRALALQTALTRPVVHDDQEASVSCSVGLARYPQDGHSVDALVRAAETALFRAKQDGRGSLRLFDHSLRERALHRQRLEGRLRRALERDQGLELHYQPLVCAADGAIVGAEALLRWDDPELGRVGPDQFIPVAEEAGLIGRLGEWVLQAACREAHRWQPRDGQRPRLSVNVSGLQLLDGSFPQTVAAALRESGLAAGQVELEITESALMEHARALPQLDRLRELGVALAVDDFGTGYSSLSKIKHLPISVLKIDRSFIQDIFTDDNDKAIVIAILAMAEQLQLKVVAEGVETPEQLAFLQAKGCQLIQGFLFSRPLPAAEFRALWGRGEPLGG